MKKAKIEELENFVWECPYKKCGHRNETNWFNTEELENEKIGAKCDECGQIIQLTL